MTEICQSLLSRDGVIIDGVWIYWTLADRNYSAIANSHTLQFTTARMKFFGTPCFHQSLRGNGFQRWTFPFLCVPEMSACLSCQHHPSSHLNSLTKPTSPLQSRVQSHIVMTVSQSVCLGVEPRLGLMTRYSYCLTVTVLSLGGRPLWREGGSVFCQSLSAVVSQLSVWTDIYILHVLHDIQYIQGLCQSGLSTADCALTPLHLNSV
jgi:hypothetical protein